MRVEHPSEGRPGGPGTAERPDRRALLAAGLALAWFALRTPPDPGLGDAAEFTLALAAAGVPHPTGYPLYVMFGSAFVRALHAVGVPWVTAAALWSGVGAAVAIGALTALAGRLPRAGSWPALAPAAMLAFNPAWISAATTAEVYTWASAWVAGATLFVVATLGALDAGRTRPARTALGWGVLCGAGLAHHATAVFFIAPLSLALAGGLRRHGAWRASLLLPAAAGAALPLAGYGFLAWRALHPAPVQWPLAPGAGELWRHATGAAYAFYLGGFDPGPLQRALLASSLLPWILPGLAWTAWSALRSTDVPVRHGLLAALLGAALLTAFAFQYRVPDPAYYFLPVLLLSLVGAVPLAAAARARARPPLAATAAAAALVAVASVGLRASVEEHRRLARVDARIRAAWEALPPGPGIVLWGDDHLHRLHVFQQLEGRRPEVVIASPNRLTWPVARAAFARRTGADPLAGVERRARGDVGAIPAAIRRQTADWVVEFPTLLGRAGAAGPHAAGGGSASGVPRGGGRWRGRAVRTARRRRFRTAAAAAPPPHPVEQSSALQSLAA